MVQPNQGHTRIWSLKDAEEPSGMPQDEARSLIELIEAKVRTSELDVWHRDALLRFRSLSLLEEEMGIEQPVIVPAQEQLASAA
jgi:hypothetical protein